MSKKILLIGGYRMNAGPDNVNRSLIEHSDSDLLYIHSTNKLLKQFETIYKFIITDVVVLSAGGSKLSLSLIKHFRKKTAYLMHGCLRYENEINQYGLSDEALSLEDYILKIADKIICVSENYSHWAAKRYPQYKDKFTFVNNGVEIKPREKVEKVPFTIAVSGGNRQIKNNDTVCKAAQKLNDEGIGCKVYIFGRNYPTGFDLSKYSCAEYVGQLDKAEYYDRLDKISLFAIDSELEPFGLVAADALNCHCSILMSDRVGASSIMKTQEEDIVDEPQNVDMVAAKIRYLLEHSNADRLLESVDVNACSEVAAYQNLKRICNSI